MSITTEKSINAFLSHIRYQKRYSPNTLNGYQNDLTSFNDFLITQYEGEGVLTATSNMVRSWLVSLREGDMQPRSINRKISSLKSFYKYLLKEKLVEVSPMGAIISPKTNKRLPQYVEKKDMDKLMSTEMFTDDFVGKTQQLIMLILYYTGIRRAELLQLKERHIDFGNCTIKVLGKGSKERIIPMNKELLNIIKQYISLKADMAYADREILLVKASGKPVTASFVYQTVKQKLSLITTIQKKSPHILRHTFATHLTGNGADLNAVKELLGHASLAATQVYTHNNIEQLKKIHKKAHPKSQ